jgi:hypothetical protein
VATEESAEAVAVRTDCVVLDALLFKQGVVELVLEISEQKLLVKSSEKQQEMLAVDFSAVAVNTLP